MKEKISCIIILLFIVINTVAFIPNPEIAVNLKPQVIERGNVIHLSVEYTFPEGMHQILQKEFFYVEVEGNTNFILGEIEYPIGKLESDGFIHLYDSATLTSTITSSPNTKPGDYTINVIAHYQLCFDDTGACVMPGREVIPVNIAVTSSRTDISTLLLYIVFALIGGFILNLTPCVLPVLSLRAFSLINQSHSEKKKITLNSLVYSSGIVFSFLVLAAVVIVLKASGELVGWGFQFQNPVFVLVMTSVIFVFSLSLFDVYTIKAPDTSFLAKVVKKESLTSSFFMGIFAVLLGTPCTAPILGAALAFAFAQPPATILMMFTFIGLGMATPFILIAFKPQIVNKLPKPGEWMNILKELMGFLLLLWAVKLLDVLYIQIGGQGVISFLFFLLSLGFSFRIIGRFVHPNISLKRKILVILLSTIIVLMVGIRTLRFTDDRLQDSHNTEIVKGRWQSFSPDNIYAAREQGKPVFIDFTAKWCTTCYTNEITVLFAGDIQEAFERKGVELFIADFTRYDEVIAQWIQKYGRVGVPVYVFYLPSEDEPIILPEIITKKMIFDILEQLPDIK